MGSGVDPMKLGRWCWARFRGEGNVVLRMVSAYRPNPNADGELSVESQHRRHLQDNNDDREARDAFMEDFDAALTSWIAMGDQVVVSADFNEEIRDPLIENLFNKHGMHHMVFCRHDPALAPPTCSRTTATKRNVDGVWGTANLVPLRCGFLEAGDFPGDHVAIWFDIAYSDAFGHDLPTVFRPLARRLRLHDSKATKRYMDEYRKRINQLNLPARQYALEASIENNILTPAQALEADEIDKLNTQAMLKAERKCRKLRMGAVQFSEATEHPRRAIAFWKYAIKRRESSLRRQAGLPSHEYSSRRWRRLKAKAKITIATRELTLDEMKQHLRTAYAEYKEAKVNDADSRLEFIKTFSEKDRARILRTEEQRRQGRVSRQINNKLSGGSVTQVLVTDPDGTQRPVSDKDGIEDACLSTNEDRYRQTEDSDWMTEPLLQDFGYRDAYLNAERILAGTYPIPDGLPDSTKMLIEEMKMPPEMADQPCPDFVSTKAHTSAWGKAREDTTAGKSGLHFGMFKAQAKDPETAAFNASIRSVAYQTGHVPPRWLTGVDFQLLKRSNDYRVEKLRNILLLEADQNMNYKQLGKDAIWHAQRTGVITEENYGQKGHRALEVSTNQRLTADLLRQKRKAAIICSNDAKGCFDRIVHIVAYIALRRFGVGRQPILGMIKAIQEMTHHIRTAFGDSDKTYGNDPTKPPLQGMLQGNGASGAAWLAISTLIVNVMKKAGFGFKTWSAISREAIDFVCYSFVDDANCLHSGPDNFTTGEDLVAQMPAVLALWESTLKATGGDIARGDDKSYWYLVDFVFKNDTWYYRKAAEVPGNLHLHNHDGTTDTITRLEVDEARECLGLQVRHDGIQDDEKNYLIQKAKKWADAVRTGHLRKKDAWYCLNSSIMKSLEYPLMATTFSKQDCDDIMKPILNAALATSGVQRLLPRNLVHGNLRSQGLGVADLYHTQLIAHLHTILRHANHPTITGKHLRDSSESLILELGSAKPFWELDYATYGVLATPRLWLANTWEALDSTSLQLKGPLPLLGILRDGDLHLMDIFVANNFSGHDLFQLNLCRMYLQAITLADITTADGRYLEHAAWHGTHFRNSPHEWPRPGKPSQACWNIWRVALRQCFLPLYSHSLKLTNPLGEWHSPTNDSWEWWYSPSDNRLYHHSNETWTPWTLVPNQYHRPKYQSSHTTVPDPPPDIRRASIYQSHNSPFRTLSNHGPHRPPPPPVPMDTLSDILEQLPPDAHWAVQRCNEFTDNGTYIANAIMDGEAVAISDGSLKNSFGTAAFVIEGATKLNRILGVNIVPGPLSDGKSYRCEISGLIAAVLVINAICKLHNITTGSVTIGCDNEAAIEIFDPGYIPNPQKDSYDMVMALRTLLRESPITWNHIHVAGHQDDKKDFPLTRLEHLNVEMDSTAKAFWNHLYLQERHSMIPPHHQVHGEGWSIWDSNDTKVASPSTSALYDCIRGPVTQQYWARHDRYPHDAITSIDWEACGDNMEALGLYRRRQVTKHASENCGVGKTLQGWKKQSHSKCPRCHADDEDTHHVLICTAQEASTVWDNNISKIDELLTTLDTEPDLQAALLLRLSQFRQQQPLTEEPWTPAIRDLIQDQDNIGWKNFLEGLPSRRWRLVQQQHYNLIGSERTSKRWLLALLKLLNNTAWDQWKHRNAILHDPEHPRQRRALQVLHQEIVEEFIAGVADLPPRDCHHFRPTLLDLLQRPLSYKKAWIHNVHSARQRQARRVTQDLELQIASKKRSRLFRWMKTGRLED